MTRETLDETLDRVAAEMTAVPPDETFIARVRPSLDRPARRGFGLRTFAIAPCLLALAVAAALMRPSGSGTRPVATSARSTCDRPTVTALETMPAGMEPSTPRAETVTATTRASGAVSTGVGIDHARADFAIPALPPPPELDVAHLALDPLVVHPVDVSSIEIAEILVADLGPAEEPKE